MNELALVIALDFVFGLVTMGDGRFGVHGVLFVVAPLVLVPPGVGVVALTFFLVDFFCFFNVNVWIGPVAIGDGDGAGLCARDIVDMSEKTKRNTNSFLLFE